MALAKLTKSYARVTNIEAPYVGLNSDSDLDLDLDPDRDPDPDHDLDPDHNPDHDLDHDHDPDHDFDHDPDRDRDRQYLCFLVRMSFSHLETKRARSVTSQPVPLCAYPRRFSVSHLRDGSTRNHYPASE